MSLSGPGVLPPMKIWDGMKSLLESKSVPTDRKGSGLGFPELMLVRLGPCKTTCWFQIIFCYFHPYLGKMNPF